MVKLNALNGHILAALLSLTALPAFAGDGGRVYCDDAADRCYRLQRDKADDYRSGDRWQNDYRWDSRYDDADYDRGRHAVCDPDGDRCYLSRSWRWDYRQYYRLHGYRWDN